MPQNLIAHDLHNSNNAHNHKTHGARLRAFCMPLNIVAAGPGLEPARPPVFP